MKRLKVSMAGAGRTDGDDEKDGYRFSLEGLALQVNYFE
jgi:hypothetical protein